MIDIIYSDLTAAKAYYKRLMHVILFNDAIKTEQDHQRLLNELRNFIPFIDGIFDNNFQITPENTTRKNHKKIESSLLAYFNILEISKSEKVKDQSLLLLNELLSLSNKIHKLISKKEFIIDLPKGILIRPKQLVKIKEVLIDERSVALYQVDELLFKNLSREEGATKISGIRMKSSREAKSLIEQAHQDLVLTLFEDAKIKLKKALTLNESAEGYNLLGFAYAKLEDMSEAKKYTLKAIAIDYEYGPALNDLGNYLMNEGKLEDAKKWFDLAKRAKYNPNPEYPYINSTRLAIMKKQMTLAKDEMRRARTLAPENENLERLSFELFKLRPISAQDLEDCAIIKENLINVNDNVIPLFPN